MYKNCATIISFINYRFDGDTFIGGKKIRLKDWKKSGGGGKNAIFGEDHRHPLLCDFVEEKCDVSSDITRFYGNSLSLIFLT